MYHKGPSDGAASHYMLRLEIYGATSVCLTVLLYGCLSGGLDCLIIQAGSFGGLGKNVDTFTLAIYTFLFAFLDVLLSSVHCICPAGCLPI